MPYTRNQIEGILTKRLHGFLVRANMIAGAPNEHLADPIGWALRLLGYNTASLDDVTDADLLPVPAAHIDALLDLAELRTAESILLNLDAVDITAGPVSTDWSDLRVDLLKFLPAKRGNVSAMWGDLLATPLDGDAPRSVRLKAL